MQPMLLDTSALQNVRYVSELLDGSHLTDGEAEYLLRRHGSVLGEELVAVGELISIYGRNGPAWLISETSLIEFARTGGEKGRRLLDWWWEWADYVQGCIDADWYPDIDVESLWIRRGPEVHEDQLALSVAPAPRHLALECVPHFGPFRDAGDRAVIRDAVRAGIPKIMTTDIDSFWRHRGYLRPFGIKVYRPTEVVAAIHPVAA